MKPDVTLFADASISSESRKSGWGYWIKGDARRSLSAGGPLRGDFHPNTSVSELEALANGLSHASAANYFRHTDQLIMLQSDNSEALGCILAARPGITENKHDDGARILSRRKPMIARQKSAVGQILQVVDQHNLTITIRHVRGHKHGGGRNWVNRLCDRLAKNGRIKAERTAA